MCYSPKAAKLNEESLASATSGARGKSLAKMGHTLKPAPLIGYQSR